MAKKYTIQYRQLKTDDLGEDANLKRMIVSAMRERRRDVIIGTNAKARIIDIDQDESYVILNKITEPGGWDEPAFSGQLIHLQQGADVAAVVQSLEEDTEEFLLQQINLGEGARVLKGILYFVAVDNHVGLIEGQAVKGRTLERYLTSLLQITDALEAGQAIILNANFLASDGKALSESSEITIMADPNPGSNAAPTGQGAQRIIEEEAARLQREGATVFDVLRTLGWDEDALAALRTEIPEDGWIEGLFKVFIKSRGRRRPISRATIDEALRNIDPADLGLRGDGTERGGIVKLSTQRTVQTNGAMIDPADAVEQIMNALRGWAAAGKINCTFE